ncbi:MAG: adenosylcobinamide-phosphate synthase CbiB [Hyphomicrobiales bacterium]
MWPFPAFAGTALALVVERQIGYPKSIHDAIGHPVEWMGKLIAALDARLNAADAEPVEGKVRGVLALALLLAAAFAPAWIASITLAQFPMGWIAEALLATAFLAQHSMREHVEAVVTGLDRSLTDGRSAVARIVGRDPAELNESGVTRAALESLAENASDGIVAPTLYYAFLGLPGLVLYKAINTADSMIGHKSPRYLDFGWAAARLDDLVNLPASRLSGLLIAGAAAFDSRDSGKAALGVIWRFARNHVSPNAGWPEAALAGALGVRLGGPRSYGGRIVDLAAMGDGRAQLTREDIRRGIKLYGRALSLLFALALAGAMLF